MKEYQTETEYIWLGGNSEPSGIRQLRSKTKVLNPQAASLIGGLKLEDIPEWAFDGSSTDQAEGKRSDCRLKPVFVCRDPIRGGRSALVFCEVLTIEKEPHKTNTRQRLVAATQQFKDDEPWIGVEQEYTLFLPDGRLLGLPEKFTPKKQGPYYCGVGADVIFGRALVEEHLTKCINAGLAIVGTNAEVMPGQWEFQIGGLNVGPLACADQLWVARWLLKRLGEKHGIVVSFSPKPKLGDWNGAGAHTNLSTKAMRDEGGMAAIHRACEKLGALHGEHMKVYGEGNEKRLTGKHETCSIDQFRWAPYDRGASVRVPIKTMDDGRGYLEDRRPAANMDPYEVFTALLETICGDGFRG